MSGKTHIAGGLLFGSATIYYANVTGYGPNADVLHVLAADASYLAGCMAGALLCDIDEPNSTIGKKLWPFSFLFAFVHWFFKLIACFLSKKSRIRKNILDISKAADHRGIMHWPLTVIILSTVFYLLLMQHISFEAPSTILSHIPIGLSVGMTSHLFYDFPSGKLALFAPFSSKKYGIKLIESNGKIDTYIIRTISLIGSAYLLFIR